MDVDQFFSPAKEKTRNHDEPDSGGPYHTLKSPPSGLKGMALGRNNSIYLSHARQSMFSPITHRPMHIQPKGQGSSTARAASMNTQKIDLSPTNKQNAINFTKTAFQNRAEGQVKPKAYNAWDILALNDMIKNRIEDQNRKQREHDQRIQMRNFYDSQVNEKILKKKQDVENDNALGKMIKDKIATIDKLTDLDNTKRMLARGQMALENVTRSNMVKQKNAIMESKAKDETLLTLEENDRANAHRTMIKQKI